ncbi:MAG: hypothetical protein ACLFSQ_01745 [Candidatus Zixiibacteriota bacterium]
MKKKLSELYKKVVKLRTKYLNVLILLIVLASYATQLNNIEIGTSQNEFNRDLRFEDSPISTSKETIDMTFDNTRNLQNLFTGFADWVNADDDVILSETSWTKLNDMEITIDQNSDNNSIIFINFSCNISDKVPGYLGPEVTIRLVRDDKKLTSRTVNLQTNTAFYHDMTIALNYTDTPTEGSHQYSIEYRIDASSYRALVNERNLQIIEINNTGSKK